MQGERTESQWKNNDVTKRFPAGTSVARRAKFLIRRAKYRRGGRDNISWFGFKLVTVVLAAKELFLPPIFSMPPISPLSNVWPLFGTWLQKVYIMYSKILQNDRRFGKQVL